MLIKSYKGRETAILKNKLVNMKGSFHETAVGTGLVSNGLRGVGVGGAYNMYTFHSRHFTVTNPLNHMSRDRPSELVYTPAVYTDCSSECDLVMPCL